MTVRSSLAKTLLATLVTAGAMATLPPVARAQHVVTEDEAGKLTFEALTATPAPVFHHVVYRTPRRTWSAHAWAGQAWSQRAVQEASYRRSIRASTTSHLGTSHRRRRG